MMTQCFKRRFQLIGVISSFLICLMVHYVCYKFIYLQENDKPLKARLHNDSNKLILGQKDEKTFITSSYHNNSDKPCPEITEAPHFIEVEKGTLLYSAWFDDRKAQRYIQVLLMTSRRKNPPFLSCEFQNGSNSNTSTVVASLYYEINSRYSGKRYGLFVASCGLPKDLVSIPCFVDISIKFTSEQPNGHFVLPVGNTRKETTKREYGICIAPLHGNIHVSELLEFLELSRLLGASQFTFYDFEISDNITKLLNYYESKGLAQVLSWKIPSYITQQDVHYYGQILAMQDCLFRSMNRLNFVAFNDIDEFIVPFHYDNMSSLLHHIHEENHCGHCFQSARFRHEVSEAQTTPWFVTQNVLNRARNADTTRPKCVDDPQRVFEHGVHLIMQPLESKYKTHQVKWDVARVFHYRKCPQPCNMPDTVTDATMQKYGERLKQNINVIRKLLNF